MGKRLIQDVIIKTKFKKPLLKTKEFIGQERQIKEEIAEKLYSIQLDVDETKKTRKIWLKMLFGILAVAIIGLVVQFILNNFSYSIINITPHQESTEVNLSLSAYRGEQKNSLGFEVMQFNKELSTQGNATGFSGEGQKANGKIIVFNTYSSSDQRLIANTRFESSDGKIYRTKTPILIPGFGSVEATVYADKSGPDYNIGLTDFTIPGLKGDPRYKKIYGRSKTEMTGGSNPSVKIISEKDIESTRNELKGKISEFLKNEAEKQKPDGYALYLDAIKINFSDIENNPKIGNTAETFVFKLNGEATIFLIKKEDLSRIVSKEYLGLEEKIDVENIENINFTLLAKNEENSEITFNIKGNAHFVWYFNEAEMIDKLMKKGSNYAEIFKDYPRIDKAEIIFKPGWWQTLPKRESHILIEKILY